MTVRIRSAMTAIALVSYLVAVVPASAQVTISVPSGNIEVPGAASLSDLTALFNAANLQKYFPGYTATDYANAATIIQSMPSNPDCVATFAQIQSGNLNQSAASMACGNYLSTQQSLYGVFGNGSMTNAQAFNAFTAILGLYAIRQSAVTVSPTIMTSNVTTYMDTVSAVLHSVGNQRRMGDSRRFSLGPQSASGLAAGEPPSRFNGWMSGSLSETRNTFALSGHWGLIGNLMGGVDYAIDDKLTAGVSGGYDYSKIKTVFSKGTMDAQGITIAPYMSYQLDSRLSVDALAGYSVGRTAVTVRSGTLATEGKPRYDRMFLATNLNYTQWFGDIQATGKLGYARATEKVAGVESLSSVDVRNTIDQARLGGQVGYWMGSWMPYVGVSYTYDLRRSYEKSLPVPMRDRDSYTLSLGADFFSKSGWNGGVVFSSEVDRKYVRSNSLIANLNYRF